MRPRNPYSAHTPEHIAYEKGFHDGTLEGRHLSVASATPVVCIIVLASVMLTLIMLAVIGLSPRT